jgi:hypothetical protein
MNTQGLNSPVNRLGKAGWIKMLNQISCCLQEMNPLTKTNICLVWKDGKGASNQACKAVVRLQSMINEKRERSLHHIDDGQRSSRWDNNC